MPDKKLFQNPEIFAYYNRGRDLVRNAMRVLVNRVVFKYAPQGREKLVIVEGGSGLGELSELLLHETLGSNFQYINIEQTQKFTEVHKSRRPYSKVVNADIYSSPLPDSSCDLYLGLSSFDTLQDLDRAMMEVARVLNNGGIFIHFLDLDPSPELMLDQIIKDNDVVAFGYYNEVKNNVLGYLVVNRNDFEKLIEILKQEAPGSEDYFIQYLKSPKEEFLRLAQSEMTFRAQVSKTIEELCSDNDINYKVINTLKLLKKKFISAIKKAGLSYVKSGKTFDMGIVNRSNAHSKFSAKNTFINDIGMLNTMDVLSGIDPEDVAEVSHMYVMIAKKELNEQ